MKLTKILFSGMICLFLLGACSTSDRNTASNDSGDLIDPYIPSTSDLNN